MASEHMVPYAPEPHERLQDVCDDVARHGDMLDAMPALTHNLTRSANVVTQGTVAFWLTTAENIGWQYAITAPAYVLGACAVASGVKHARNWRTGRRMQHREAAQAPLREELGEPVDIFVTPRRKKRDEPSLTMRWYGADRGNLDTEEPTRGLSSRLERLVATAEQTSVANIALASNWLTELDHPVDPTEYGKLHPARTFTDVLGKGKRLQITDKLAEQDETVLMATVADCRRLVAELKENQDADIRQYLLDVIAAGDIHSKIPSIYARLSDAPNESAVTLPSLKRHLEAEIERSLAVNAESEPIIEKDELGVLHKIRTHTATTVRGGNVSVLDSYNNHEGHPLTRHQGSQSLLRYLGAADTDELIAKIHDLPAGSKAATYAKSALLLLLKAEDEHEAASDASLPGGSGGPAQPTLLERAQTETPWQSRRSVRRAKRHGVEPTVEYTHRRSFTKRFIATTALIGASVIVGGSVGHSQQATAQYIYSERSDDFKAKYGDSQYAYPDLYQHFVDQRPWLENAFYKTVQGVELAQYKAETLSLEGLQAIGLENVGRALGFTYFFDMQGVDYKPTPIAGDFTQMTSTPSGDVLHTSNLPVYNITPYNGNTAAGYWASSVNEILGLTTGYPLSQMPIFSSNDHPEPLTVPLSPPDMGQVAYEISTDAFNGGMGGIPIKDGTAIVAAQISYVDGEGATHLLQPGLYFDAAKGTYSAYYDSRQTEPRTPNVVTFRYWLADDQTNIVHASGPMETLLHADLPAVAATTKQALGLAPNATDDEVKAAIKAKSYSFTPFLDAGVPPTAINGDYKNSTPQVEQIATTMAELPSANCNIAAATYVLATDGMHNGEGVNVVSGFHNTNGDNVLSTLEAHAWAVDTDGAIVDATPAGGSLPPLENAETNDDTNLAALAAMGGTALLAAGAGFFAFRRRRAIAERVHRFRDNRALQSKHAPRAITALQYALYSAGEPRHFAAGESDETWVRSVEAHTPAARIAALPDLSTKDASTLIADTNVTLSRPVRRALKAVLGRRPHIVDTQKPQQNTAALAD